jgi:hypothetical protein
VRELPEQIVLAEPVKADGTGFTVIVTELELIHPLAFVSVTVYVVLILGLTEGLAEVEENPEGLLVHE